MKNHLKELKGLLKEELNLLSSTVDDFEWSTPACYADWLSQTYYYVCHSTRLLALAASRYDRTHNSHHLRCIDHMKEERSHEVLASNDISKIGFGIKDFSELPATAALYQTQYYRIEHESPLSLYGYILLLEGYASTKGSLIYKKIKETFGKSAGTFWAVHSEDDIEHIETAFQQLKNLNELETEIVSKSIRDSRTYYAEMLMQIMKRQSGQREQSNLLTLGNRQ